METKLTKRIKNLLQHYNPQELAGQKLNKMRPHFVVNEVVVETGTNIGGVVDVMRLDETLINRRDFRICKCANYLKKHNIPYPFSDKAICSYDDYSFPYRCENLNCPCNTYEIHQENDILITCFEIKISKSDFHSKNGHNFVGQANYYVMPFSLYKEIKDEIPDDIGVVVMHETANSIGLRKIKECKYQKLDDNTQKWLVLNILKKYNKENNNE